MDPIVIVGLLLFGILAGVLGTLFGLGGGVILVPALTILFDLSPTQAAAISLIGIVAASVGAASFYVEKRVSNVRLGLLLEISTAAGAILGAMLAVFVDEIWLTLLFVAILIYSGARMIMNKEQCVQTESPEEAEFSYHDIKENKDFGYDVQNVKTGSLVCGFAGVLSSMTGVGGGAIKVPLMNLHMNVPIKAAAATSSYMIGITAFSGAITYFLGGEVMLIYAALIAVGSFVGSGIGSYASKYIPGGQLRKYFSLLLFFLAAITLLSAGGII